MGRICTSVRGPSSNTFRPSLAASTFNLLVFSSFLFLATFLAWQESSLFKIPCSWSHSWGLHEQVWLMEHRVYLLWTADWKVSSMCFRGDSWFILVALFHIVPCCFVCIINGFLSHQLYTSCIFSEAIRFTSSFSSFVLRSMFCCALLNLLYVRSILAAQYTICGPWRWRPEDDD